MTDLTPNLSYPAPQQRPKLAVGAVIGAAFGAVMGNWRAYARAAFIPFVVSIVVSIVMLAFGFKFDPQKPSMPDALGFLIANVVMLIVMTTFYAKVCRIVLGPAPVGHGPGDAPIGWVWQQAEWRYLGYFVLLAILFGFLAGFVGAIFFIVAGRLGGLFLAFWAVLGVAAMFSRFLFVFPAVSAGHPTGLGIAWQQTRGNAWRLIGVYVLLMLIMTGAQIPILLVGLLSLHLSGDAPFVQLLVSAFARVVGLGVGAIFLTGVAIAYGRVTGYPIWLPQKAPPPAPTAPPG